MVRFCAWDKVAVNRSKCLCLMGYTVERILKMTVLEQGGVVRDPL